MRLQASQLRLILPWTQGREVYRGDYTYGSHDHVGPDSFALDFCISPTTPPGTDPNVATPCDFGGGTGGPTGHERDVDAIASGTVVWAGWYNVPGNTLDCYGYSVIIEHDFTYTDQNNVKHWYYSLYAHMNDNVHLWQPGQHVNQGQKIGEESNTGSGLTQCGQAQNNYQFGPHLHFVLYQQDSDTGVLTSPSLPNPTAVVPEPFIGQDSSGRPTVYENFEWYGTSSRMIGGAALSTSAANPGGTWNSGAPADQTPIPYNQPVHFTAHVTDTVNIAEVHFTVNYLNSAWNDPNAFSTPVAFPSHAIWRIVADCNPSGCRGGKGSWTGTAQSADVAFDWYPAQEVGTNADIGSLVDWLPPAVPALTSQSTTSTSICISFDVVDTAGVENLAPNGVHCITTGTNPQSHPHTQNASKTSTSPGGPLDNTSRQVTLNPPAVPGCPTNGTWMGLPYLNRFYTGQNDTNGVCTYYISSNTLESLTLASGTNYMESDITVDNDVTLTIPTGATLIDSGGTLYVKGELSVQPGVTMRFAPGPRGVWVQGGILNMAGTSTQPIVLTSSAASPAPGDWRGIQFTSSNGTPASGALSYVQVSYAGYYFEVYYAPGNYFIYYRTGILALNAGVTPTLSNVTVDHSLSDGVTIDFGANPSMSSLTLTNNGTGSWPGNAIEYDFPPTNLGPSQLSGVSASGNLHNVISIVSNANNATYSGTGTWQNVGLPLSVTGGITLPSSTSLTLDDGLSVAAVNGNIEAQSTSQLTLGKTVTIGSMNGSILIDQNSTLTIGSNSTIKFAPGSNGLWDRGGTLNLQGTTAPILLTSAAATPAPGDWQGVIFTSSNDTAPSGTLKYVRISYAGQNQNGYHTAILVSTGSPAINWSNVDHSAGNGVEVTNGASPNLELDAYDQIPTSSYGVVNDGWTTGQPLVDAKGSWWGSTTGPTVSGNPTGLGVKVGPGVDWSGWCSFNSRTCGGLL